MINSIDILTLFYDILTTTTTNGVNTYYGKHRNPEDFFETTCLTSLPDQLIGLNRDKRY
jgi:hypothetical protein